MVNPLARLLPMLYTSAVDALHVRCGYFTRLLWILYSSCVRYRLRREQSLSHRFALLTAYRVQHDLS